MIWLALEFSSDRRSVAVASASTLVETIHQGTVQTPIFKLIGDALDRAGVSRAQVDAIAVGLGPGSYTGVRLALAVAQGWSLATDVRVTGLSSLECLAVSAANSTGPMLLAVDAQRGEFATALAEGGRLIEQIQLRTLEQIRQRYAAGTRVGGPEIARQLTGAFELFPSASDLVPLAKRHPVFVPVEQLAPIYLREAKFVKAPPPRDLGPSVMDP
ncbi:MAG TPA: tRNA (adenosine(37)-N6)-threonylcarbamoyltransferase complex dimerization subunit type 1 TsaB [Verrucomicrobiota bacterium]|nr:tRNA (adenosine(37)-N6)-threonylcarbamoyltransferase complex dimerization subunit type 1 TsaB [Verrucomicrobiales bacterium]HRI16465.1 tRNA (adenosine(37)-N6)-threonylcarbamoyltransferase complex dimerization subunit type 1 TsaB [Verrucomicrobiota bacterium]